VLKHDPEKACPALDPGWIPVFGKDVAQTKELRRAPISRGALSSLPFAADLADYRHPLLNLGEGLLIGCFAAH
jgi:hypothetical protein